MQKLVYSLFLCTTVLFSTIAQNNTVKENRSFVERFVIAAQQQIDTIVAHAERDDQLAAMGSISVMSGSTTFKQLRANHKTLIDLAMPEDETGEAMRIAGYCKLAIPLVLRMNDTLIAQLARIDEMLLYWRYQEEHWFYYLSHKDPTKFVSEDQFEETEKKVHALERLQDRYYTVLGSLLVHLSTFSLDADIKQQNDWLKGLFSSIITIVPKQVAPEATASLDQFFMKAVTVTGMLSRSFDKQIAPYDIPTWYKRYWMASSATALSLFLAGRSLYRNKDSIEGGVQTVKNRASDYKERVMQFLQRDKEWGNKLSQDKSILIGDYRNCLRNHLPYFTQDNQQRRKILEGIIDDKLKELKYTLIRNNNSNDINLIIGKAKADSKFDMNARPPGLSSTCDSLDTIWQCIFDRPMPQPKHYLDALDANKLRQFNLVAIEKAAGELDRDYLKQVVFPVVFSGGISQEGGTVKEAISQSIQITEKLDTGVRTNLVSGASDGRYTINEGINRVGASCTNVPELIDTIRNSPDLIWLYTEVIEWHSSHLFYNFKEANKLFFMFITGVIALYPIYKSIGLSWNIYKWWRGTETYEELMQALTGLMRMFIQYGDAHPTEMEHDDVGIIYYLTHKLELEGQKVPKKYRKSFMRDVRLIQSSDFTPRQKHHIIRDVILNKYPFLRKQVVAESA